MIIAKTKMKKIPKSCTKCRLSECSINGRVCLVTYKYIAMKQTASRNWRYVKPDWCPLIDVQEVKEK